MRLSAVAFVIMTMAACSDPPTTVVDGSSPVAFDRSVARARRDLPIEDRIVFDRAIKSIGGRRMAARDSDALARVTFDGMTAAQIVADQKSRDQ